MTSHLREIDQDLSENPPRFQELQTLQVNLGTLCNQHCLHCHLRASPRSKKMMSREVMQKIIEFLGKHQGLTLDITGGAPELHPDLRFLVEKARPFISRLMARTNLTTFLESGMEWIPGFYRNHQVTVVASLPCYTKENVDRQRGNGAFEKSIKALRKLNELGYGDSLELNLVYNPGGDFLPGSQRELERDYKRELLENHGIKFHSLYAITNSPLGRFRDYLRRNGRLEQYIRLLVNSFNPDAACSLMCRTLISISWQGVLYNCDFNLAAELPIKDTAGRILDVGHIEDAIQEGFKITIAEHCYSCTAGSGSSCTGILT